MPFLEWSLGLLIGFLGVRAGLFSLFSVLILLPFFPWEAHPIFVLGLSGSLIASTSEGVSPFHSLHSLVGIGVGFLGVWLLLPLSPFLGFLSAGLPFILGVGLVGLFITSPHPKGVLLAGMGLVLLVGYLVLVRWVVPLGVPSVLMGFAGFRPFPSRAEGDFRFVSSLRDGLFGILTGFLPGIGPGLVGVVHGRFSPSLGVSNLVFSLGLVSLLGNVRSAPAAALAFLSLPSWESLFFWLILSAFVSGWVFTSLSFRWDPPLFFPWVVNAAVLFFAGGWLSLGCGLMSVCLSRVLEFFRLPPELILLFLLPSLWLFYS